MSFNVSEEKAWKAQNEKIWNEVESQLFEKTAKMVTDKRRRQVRLWQVENVEKTHKDQFSWSRRSMQFNCNAVAVLKIDSVYKQGKSYDPQVYVEECKYTDTEKRQCVC